MFYKPVFIILDIYLIIIQLLSEVEVKGEIVAKQNSICLHKQEISKHIFSIVPCFSTEQ